MTLLSESIIEKFKGKGYTIIYINDSKLDEEDFKPFKPMRPMTKDLPKIKLYKPKIKEQIKGVL